MPTCTYCHRELVARGKVHHLALTRDHVVPRSKGGLKTVPACWQCNGIKADMPPDQWIVYMANNPRWWETNIIRPGKIKAPPIADTRAFLSEAHRKALAYTNKIKATMTLPKEYEDETAQAAFELVYMNRRHLLRY